MKKIFETMQHIFNTAAIIFVLSSCNSDKKDASHYDCFTSYDEYKGFLPYDFRVIQSSYAHSGNYVNKMDTAFPYSLNATGRWGDFTTKQIKEVRGDYWVYPTQTNQSVFLVCVYEYPGSTQPFYYEFYDAAKSLTKANEWQFVSTTFYLPDTIDPNLTFKMFIWNKGVQPAYVDDFGIQFIEKAN